MDNSIYVTLSRQAALFRDMDITANNLANANTTAYQSEHIIFDSLVTYDVNQGDRNPLVFSDNLHSYRDTRNASLTVTGNDLDLAIKGDGFFAVDTPGGIRYTRAGKFMLDSTGQLVTPDGYPVLDAASKPIIFPPETQAVKIGSAGNVKLDGEDFGFIGIWEFSNPNLLNRVDNKIFVSDAPPREATNSTIAQGVIEDSNVQPVTELTNMISISRAVGSTAKFIETMYDLQRKASNTFAQQQ